MPAAIKWAPETLQELIKQHQSGLGMLRLSHQFDASPAAIRELLIRLGIPMRPKTRKSQHRWNDVYFREIDSEQKAYWLGFIAADGNVLVKPWHRLTIRLAPYDAPHIQRFLDTIQSNHVVHQFCTRRTKISACVAISAPGMVQDLIHHGIIPRKSLTLEWPTLTPSLYPHYLRGYSDGDGSFGIRRDRPLPYLRWTLAGNKTFLTSVQSYLNETIGLVPTKLLKRSDNCFVIECSGPRKTLPIVNLLYTGATIWLPRKRAIIAQCLPQFTEDLCVRPLA